MLAFIIAMAVAATPPIPFEKTYDRFSGMTRIISGTPLPGIPGGTFIVTAIHRGDRVEAGDTVRYSLKFWTSHHGRWRYLSCHNFSMLADGKPVVLPRSEHDGEVDSGYTYEYVDVGWVDLQALLTIVSANKVELQVCNDEWTIPQRAVTDIERIIAMTTPPGSSPKWKERALVVDPAVPDKPVQPPVVDRVPSVPDDEDD